MADAPPATEETPSARALLKERDYLLFWGSRWTGSFASQIQSVAMGWHMYALARENHSVEESAFSALETSLLEAQSWEPLVADAITKALEEKPVDLKLEPLGVFALSQVQPPQAPEGAPQLPPPANKG